MAKTETSAPTFTYLLKSEAVPSDDRIDVIFGTDAKEGYRFGIHTSIVPRLMLELGGRFEQLRPDGAERLTTTGVRPKTIQFGVHANGTPALLVQMDGYHVVLELTDEAARIVHKGLGEFLAPH